MPRLPGRVRRVRPIVGGVAAALFALSTYATWWTLRMKRFNVEAWLLPGVAALVASAVMLASVHRPRDRAMALIASILYVVGMGAIAKQEHAKKIASDMAIHASLEKAKAQNLRLARVCQGAPLEGWSPPSEGGAPTGAYFVVGESERASHLLALDPPWTGTPLSELSVVVCVRRDTRRVDSCPYVVPGTPSRNVYDPSLKRHRRIVGSAARQGSYPREEVTTYATLREAKSGRVLASHTWPAGPPPPCLSVLPSRPESTRLVGAQPTPSEIVAPFASWLSNEAGTPFHR